jgi:hypothetical protein
MGVITRQARPAIFRKPKLKQANVSDLVALGRETRKHPLRQIRKIANCIRKFGTGRRCP